MRAQLQNTVNLKAPCSPQTHSYNVIFHTILDDFLKTKVLMQLPFLNHW